MPRKVFWRGGGNVIGVGGATNFCYDGCQNHPTLCNGDDDTCTRLADDSNWVLADGHKAHAPRDDDIVIFDKHALTVPLPDISGWSEDDMREYMADEYHEDRFLQDYPFEVGGIRRGNHYPCNLFYWEWLPGNEYAYSGRTMPSNLGFGKLIVTPDYTGEIGIVRQQAGDNRWTIKKLNPLALHFNTDGGIIFENEGIAYFRCSSKCQDFQIVASVWTDVGGAFEEDSEIYFLDVNTTKGTLIISSQFNDASYRSKWHLIRVYDAGFIHALEKESNLYCDFAGSEQQAKCFDLPEGTVIENIVTRGESAIIRIGKDCVDKSNEDVATNVTGYRGQVVSESPLENVILKGLDLTVGRYNIGGEVEAGIQSLLSYAGFLEWYSRGILVEGEIHGGKIKLMGAGNKKLGYFSAQDNYVARWKMNDDEPDANIVDDAGGGHNGSLQVNNSEDIQVAGKINGSLDFTPNEYAIVPDHADLSFVSGGVDKPFTLHVWIYRDGSRCPVFCKTSEYWFSVVSAGQVEFRIIDQSTGGFIRAMDTAAFGTGEWKQLVGTYDGSASQNGIHIYINTVQVCDNHAKSGVYNSMVDTANPLWLGREAGFYANAKYDAMMIFDRVLTQKEIEFLYNLGVGREDSSSTIKLYGGTLDLSEAKGFVDMGEDDSHVRKIGGVLIPQVESKYEVVKL